MAEVTYLEALRQGLLEEMERDENVFILGEDIGIYGGAFKVTDGFLDRFGATSGGTGLLGHVLAKDLGGPRPLHQHRSEISNKWRKHIAALQRIGTRHALSFLPERAVQAADDFALAIKIDQAFLERAREPQVIINLGSLK